MHLVSRGSGLWSRPYLLFRFPRLEQLPWVAEDCSRRNIRYRWCDKARTVGWLVGASDFQRASLDYLSTDGKQSGYMAINSEGLQGCKLILYLRVTFEFNGCLLVVYSRAHMILIMFARNDLLTFYVLAYAQVDTANPLCFGLSPR